MDAISFVLSVQSRDLRSSQMRDLIFRPPGAARDENLSARASLVYVEPSKKNDNEEEGGGTDGEDNSPAKNAKKSRLARRLPAGKTTIFSRVISTSGAGGYQVNGKPVTFKQYESRLASIGVLLKARNFLVFQGDVEAMTRKNPRQLVEMFENISGSAEMRREEYEAAAKAKEEAEQATIFPFNKTKEHKSERRVLKEQKVSSLRGARRGIAGHHYFCTSSSNTRESLADQ